MTKAHSLIVLLLSFKYVRGNDVSSASVDIASLIKSHRFVVEGVQYYLESEYKRIEILKRYLNSYKEEHEKMTRNNNYVLNPLNAYTLMFRLTEELDIIKYIINDNKGAEFLQKPDDIRFPVKEDLDGAVAALWSLQTKYNLNTTLLAAGILQGTFGSGNKISEEISSPMSVGALFHVGRVVYSLKDYATALQWLHEALKKYESRDPYDSYLYDDTHIIDYIRSAYHGIHDFKNAIAWTEKLMKLMPQRDDLNDVMNFYHGELAKSATKNDAAAVTGELQQGKGNYLEFEKYYSELCRGEVTMAEEKKKSLYCFYKRGPNPFLKLAPFKTELLHREPDVHLFYDTISDAEIESVRQISEPKLVRATFGRDNQRFESPQRICEVAWVADEDSPLVAQLSQRVADFADLNLKSAEELQVAKYGLGGHYAPHYDFFNQSSSDTKILDGDRIATIMFYMSEVEQGGATVFLNLHLTVFPVKNAAIMWANLLPSGQSDHRTMHAACPVLKGSKWVSNKWVRERCQEFHRPCSLEYQENSNLHFSFMLANQEKSY